MKKATLAFLVNSYCKLPNHSRTIIANDLFNAGVSVDWIHDVIHFNYNPLLGERPTVMTEIGRGIDQLTTLGRLDWSSIVLGRNGKVDYPDLCNVYVESAKCRYTNEEMSDDQLDELSDNHELKMECLV